MRSMRWPCHPDDELPTTATSSPGELPWPLRLGAGPRRAGRRRRGGSRASQAVALRSRAGRNRSTFPARRRSACTPAPFPVSDARVLRRLPGGRKPIAGL
jgi:hypothetical protein